MFFVFAAEVGGVFVADAEAGVCYIEFFAEHQAAGFLKTDLFLKLDRTHRGYAFEMMMKTRHAHSQIAG